MDGNRIPGPGEQAPQVKPKDRALLRGAGSVLGLFVVLFAVWHWPLVVSVSKPALISIHPGFAVEVKASGYSPDDNLLIYPRLGIKVPLTESAQTSPLRIQDWPALSTALRKGVSLAYESPSFEQSSFSYVTGHSSDSYPNPYSSAFAALGKAKEGDEVYLVRSGKLTEYKVVSTRIVNPQDAASFSKEQLHPSDTPALALVTCWPVLTTRNRMVVVAEKSE